MKFRLEFNVPNDDDIDSDGIIAYTLSEIVNKIEHYGTAASRVIRDGNGNTIGAWDLIPDA